MKARETNLVHESAQIHKQQYRSSNPLTLLKTVFAVLLTGQSTINTYRSIRVKK
jgi:hypothetical protein